MLQAVVAIYMLLFMQAISALAESPPAHISGPATADALRGHVDFLLDPGGALSIADVTRPGIAAQFAPLTASEANFGYTQAAIWLRFALTNAADDTGSWRILFRQNFMQWFAVHVLRDDGTVEVVTDMDPSAAFADRPLETPTLAAAFDLAPGATAVIFVRYVSGGSSSLSWSIETPTSLNELEARATAKNFIYYGMMIILIVIAAFAFLMSRRPVFIAYAGYAGCALLYIMHSDGNGFKFLWPEAAAFNAYASVTFGAGIIISGSLFSKLFLRTRRFHPVIDKVLGAIILLTLGMLAASAFLDHQPIKKMLVLLAFAAIATFVLAGLVAARARFKQVRFYVLAWTGAVASSALMVGRHWLGIDIPASVQFDSMRIVMVTDAALMGLAIWDNFNQLRQARQSALQANLVQTAHNLELTRRLEDLEEQYDAAREIAEQKGRIYADTIHDLNQPLHALRLDLRRLAHGTGKGAQSRARIEETLAYLERLVARQLHHAIEHEPESQTPVDGELPAIGIGDTLRAIRDMFAADAAAKGIELRLVPCTRSMTIEPLVVMRIVTNLVSNAIKYTEDGRILIGCRRQGAALRVEVHDTGSGMTAEEFAAATARGVRLDKTAAQAAGHGLGLAIASSLARDHGYALAMLPRRSRGTGVALTLPGPEGRAAR